MERLLWAKSIDNKWVNLSNMDLTNLHATGVYIIWHGGNNPRIVRIGQGNIAARLAAHRLNHQIMRFAEDGPMMVTWAEISDQARRDGIEAYLVRQFTPLIKDQISHVLPIAASSPFL
ncbi:MAG: hypothetical protein HKN36_02260 [Hellea sp.]|nr:hypothetical protein [Hellea sp.]